MDGCSVVLPRILCASCDRKEGVFLENLYHSSLISRASDQNGVSQARYIVEIHHSGWKPSIFLQCGRGCVCVCVCVLQSSVEKTKACSYLFCSGWRRRRGGGVGGGEQGRHSYEYLTNFENGRDDGTVRSSVDCVAVVVRVLSDLLGLHFLAKKSENKRERERKCML